MDRAAVKSAGNSKLIVVDASKGITWLDVPDLKTIASGEHIHTKGNPYYWMDPLNGPIILGNIAQALAFVSSENREFIQSNQRTYEATLRARLRGMEEKAAPLEGSSLSVTMTSGPTSPSVQVENASPHRASARNPTFPQKPEGSHL